MATAMGMRCSLDMNLPASVVFGQARLWPVFHNVGERRETLEQQCCLNLSSCALAIQVSGKSDQPLLRLSREFPQSLHVNF